MYLQCFFAMSKHVPKKFAMLQIACKNEELEAICKLFAANTSKTYRISCCAANFLQIHCNFFCKPSSKNCIFEILLTMQKKCSVFAMFLCNVKTCAQKICYVFALRVCYVFAMSKKLLCSFAMFFALQFRFVMSKHLLCSFAMFLLCNFALSCQNICSAVLLCQSIM